MIIIFCFLPFLICLCSSGGSWYCRIQGRSWTQRRNCKLWSTFSVYWIHLWSRVYPGLGQKLSPVPSSCSPHAKSRPSWEKLSLVPPKCVSSICKGSDPDGVQRLQHNFCTFDKRNSTILHCRDLLVFKDLLDNKVKKGSGGPGVSLVLLDLLDHLERE